MTAYTYILFSTKLNKYYIGSTSDMERRLAEHKRGKEKFTSTGVPWVLVHTEQFIVLKDARKREAFIKKQKSRKFIEHLINSVG